MPLHCTFCVFNLATATKCWRTIRPSTENRSQFLGWRILGAVLSHLDNTQQRISGAAARGEKLNGKQQNNGVRVLVFTFLAFLPQRVFFAKFGDAVGVILRGNALEIIKRGLPESQRECVRIYPYKERERDAAPVQIPLVAFNDSPRKLEAGHKPKGSERAPNRAIILPPWKLT